MIWRSDYEIYLRKKSVDAEMEDTGLTPQESKPTSREVLLHDQNSTEPARFEGTRRSNIGINKRPPITPSDRLDYPPLPGSTGYKWISFPFPQDGAEEALSSSQDNLLTVPHSLRRRILRYPLQAPRYRP